MAPEPPQATVEGDEPASSDRQISVWRKIAYSAVVTFVCFGLVEIGLALLGVRPPLVQEDPYVGFSGAVPLFVESPDGGQLRTAPNKLALFNEQSFSRRKPPGSLRIFTLGGSTTYGRPFDDRTSFSGWLRHYLARVGAGRRYEVINAGGISYASYRVAAVMEELVDYEPDLFVLYCGHNEFLERRTYPRLIAEPAALTRTRLLLYRSRLFGLGQRLLAARQRESEQRALLAGEVEEILDRSVGLDEYHRDDEFRRQVLAHYQFNLERMATLAKQRGAGLLLVSTPSNVRDFAPFKSELPAGSDAALGDRVAQLLGTAREALAEDRGDAALAATQQAVDLAPRHAEAEFLLGRSLLATGDAASAAVPLGRALEEDICSLRALPEEDAILRQVARQAAVPLVDFRRILEARAVEQSGQPLLGDDFFLDHVHPTIASHGLLARALLEEMAALGLVPPSTSWPADLDADVDRLVTAQVGPEEEARAHKNLAKVLLWAGKKEESERFLRRAEKLLGGDWEVHYQAGVLHLDHGEVDQAVLRLQQAASLAPGAAQAQDQLGVALSAAGDLDGAVAAAERAVELAPADAGSWNNLATHYLARGEAARSLGVARRAAELDPSFADAFNTIGAAALALGDLRAATAALSRALELRPGFAAALLNLGLVRASGGLFQEAIAAFDLALAAAPGLVEAGVARGHALLALGRPDEAKVGFERALELSPGRADLWQALAVSLVQLGRRDEAHAMVRRGLQQLDAPILHHLRGRLLAEEGQLAEAIRELELAVAGEPGLIDGWLDLSRAQSFAGHREKAIEVYRQALASNPEDPRLHRALGEALVAAGRQAEAAEHLSRAG